MSAILEPIQTAAGPNLLVGFDTADDAGVYQLSADRAIVCTADFITPVVDDPRTFGRVAAANSISDVYAMGGTPLVALNLLGYPPASLPSAVLGEILAGAGEVCAEAGCAVAGGHTVRDEEVKFGLSVTGEVHPDKILRNSTAQPGDFLVLTKPLGTGALVAAMKKNQLEADHLQQLITCMTSLNRCGTLLFDLGATACTDVTGFGLSGHALEMAKGSGLTLHIDPQTLPLLPKADSLCAEGFTCGGTKANARFASGDVSYGADLNEGMIGLINDPQTSGGLLISVPANRLDALRATVVENGAMCASVIGQVTSRVPGAPYLVFGKKPIAT